MNEPYGDAEKQRVEIIEIGVEIADAAWKLTFWHDEGAFQGWEEVVDEVGKDSLVVRHGAVLVNLLQSEDAC